MENRHLVMKCIMPSLLQRGKRYAENIVVIKASKHRRIHKNRRIREEE